MIPLEANVGFTNLVFLFLKGSYFGKGRLFAQFRDHYGPSCVHDLGCYPVEI